MARRLTLESLRRGRHVVTANKRLLAPTGWNSSKPPHRPPAPVFRGSGGGRHPDLTLHRSLAANRIHRVLGILNGTTNYILTRIKHTGAALSVALAEAQGKASPSATPPST